MARLRLFGPARETAGTGADEVPGETVEDVLREATIRFGARFADIVEVSRIWVNGEAAEPGTHVGSDDEVAVLPPVSGG